MVAFETLDAAVDGLYRAASRQRRHKMRAAAQVAEEFDGALTDPEFLSQNQLTRLARAVQAGMAEVMRAALAATRRSGASAEWELILPNILEAEATPLPDTAQARPGRPRRLARIRRGLIIRRAMTRDGWVLHFSGKEATSDMIEEIIDDVEERWGR